MVYIVKSVVCDYGVYEKTDDGERLIVICNSLSNAKLIADILNTDLNNTRYDVKVDKAIDEIIEKSFISDIYNDKTDDEIIKVDDVLEIVKRNIGE